MKVQDAARDRLNLARSTPTFAPLPRSNACTKVHTTVTLRTMNCRGRKSRENSMFANYSGLTMMPTRFAIVRPVLCNEITPVNDYQCR